MDYPDVLLDIDQHIATVTLNRPQILNALSSAMFSSLDQVYQRIEEDDEIRVVIITGAGRGFCSGIDLNQTKFVGGPPRRPAFDPREYWTFKVQALSKPTIAAVNGVAVGGGMALALACDIRIASDQARFSTRFSAIGMSVLDGMGNLLPRTVGLSKALELLYTSEMLDAAAAERIGLVSHVVPQEKLMERTMELAEKIASGPPIGLQLTKHVVYSGLNKNFQDHLPYQQYTTQINASLVPHDVVEGGRAFAERRDPKFKGIVSPEEGTSES